MVLKAERKKAKKHLATRLSLATAIQKNAAQLGALVRDLKATAAKIARKKPRAAIGDSVASAVNEVAASLNEISATVRQSLHKLLVVQPRAEHQVAKIPEPDAEGNYAAEETLRAIIAIRIADRRQLVGL